MRLYREGLADVLRKHGTFTVAGTAAGGPGALDCVRRCRPGVVLVDVAAPGDVGILTELRAASPASRVVVLGVAETGPEVLACVEAGAAGYVPRNGSLRDLIETLELAGRGEAVCPPQILAALLSRVAELTGGGALTTRGSEQLTSRELQVLRLIENGLTNKEIAERLSMALSTVKNHTHSIFDKLQIRRRAEAVAWVRRHHRTWDPA
ncbi:response regulator transcription factor [Actinoplanes sp. NPDC051861]|uniref:response regulator transcription factor n=1 Tax=Actinoplanes sp. NPDC051861 TaxID=3155170 RepID=UPI0034139045